MKGYLLISCLLLYQVLAGYLTIASAATLYKWVDKDGNISYQDEPPPEGVEFTEQELSNESSDDAEAGSRSAGNRQKVKFFTVPDCGPCVRVRAYLTENQIPFQEQNVADDDVAQQTLLELVGRVQVPSIAFGKTFWNGNALDELQQMLANAGYSLAEKDSNETQSSSKEE